MPRPRRFRRVRFWPEVTYFKPAGVQLRELEEAVLTVDEFEALRLKDLEDMDQGAAAKKMGISQPTFNRLLKSARKKAADAIVNGKAIRVEGGPYKMVGPALRRAGRGLGGPPEACVCPACGTRQPKQRGVPCARNKCPKCGAVMIRGKKGGKT
jgi:predicted DNA-binding protein (UPF0251 family)